MLIKTITVVSRTECCGIAMYDLQFRLGNTNPSTVPLGAILPDPLCAQMPGLPSTSAGDPVSNKGLPLASLLPHC